MFRLIPFSYLGGLSTNDPDNVDGHTPQSFEYEVLDTSSNFAICNNNSLCTRQPLDYEAQNNHLLTIKVTDDGNPRLSFNKTFSVNVIGKFHLRF